MSKSLTPVRDWMQKNVHKHVQGGVVNVKSLGIDAELIFGTDENRTIGFYNTVALSVADQYEEKKEYIDGEIYE
jgi:hypothetical protein